MSDTSDNEYFARYFHDRADLADELAGREFSVEAHILASTALDALGEVWLHDFPDEREAMEQELGGKVPASIRMTRLVKRFAVGSAHVGKVAVVLFAVDWKKHGTPPATDADALLTPRLGRVRGELPYAHLDVSREELVRECPAISASARLTALVEEYEYPAVLYRFVRSPFVHTGTASKRTHGFTRGEEVFYMPLVQGMTIGIAVGAVTAWLRAAAASYVGECNQRGIRPATDIEPARQAEDVLESRWKRALSP
jgi:hypothetical protein